MNSFIKRRFRAKAVVLRSMQPSHPTWHRDLRDVLGADLAKCRLAHRGKGGVPDLLLLDKLKISATESKTSNTNGRLDIVWILYTPWECKFIHTTGVQMIDNWCVCVCVCELEMTFRFYNWSKKYGTVTLSPLAFCWSLQIVQIYFFPSNTITGREHDWNYGNEIASDNIA